MRVYRIAVFWAGAFVLALSVAAQPEEPCERALFGFSLLNVESGIPFDGILGGPPGDGKAVIRAEEGIKTRATAYAAITSIIEDDSYDEGVCAWTLSVVVEGEAVPARVSFRRSAAGPHLDGGFESTGMVDPAVNGGRQGFVSLVVLSFHPCSLPKVATTSVLEMEIEETRPHARTDAEALVRFEDGLRYRSNTEQKNVFIYRGEAIPPCNKDTASLTVVFSLDGPRFVRGNADGDGPVDVSDALFILRQLFEESRTATCPAASDTNADGLVDISDAIYLLAHLFQGGPSPAAPFPDCGPDPTSAGESLPCPELPPGCG